MLIAWDTSPKGLPYPSKGREEGVTPLVRSHMLAYASPRACGCSQPRDVPDLHRCLLAASRRGFSGAAPLAAHVLTRPDGQNAKALKAFAVRGADTSHFWATAKSLRARFVFYQVRTDGKRTIPHARGLCSRVAVAQRSRHHPAVLRPNTSIAASRPCSFVRPGQPVSLANALEVHFVAPACGAML